MVIIRGPWPERPEPQDESADGGEQAAASPPEALESALRPSRSRVYRRRDDPAHVLRFDQLPPKALQTKLAEYVEVAGIGQAEARRAAEAFALGEGQYLLLERDPTNRFDRHAIKVIGVWKTAAGEGRRVQLGWVPRELAQMIAAAAPDSPLAATIRVLFLPRPDAGPGLRFDIWQARGGPRLRWPP